MTVQLPSLQLKVELVPEFAQAHTLQSKLLAIYSSVQADRISNRPYCAKELHIGVMSAYLV